MKNQSQLLLENGTKREYSVTSSSRGRCTCTPKGPIYLAFAELDITSNFTFLTGASHPEEYVDRAALLGLDALAIADENSVAGIVRAYARMKEIARQVRELQETEKIGPPAPLAGWAPLPPVHESYPGGTARRSARSPGPSPWSG